MRNIFVTGGTGLIGGHIVAEVLQQEPQAKVVVLAQSIDPQSFFVRSGLKDRVVLVYGDLRDQHTVRDAVFYHEIDTIFHLAAQPLVTVALANPRDTWETNVMGTVNVMEAARQNPLLQAVVVASSDKAYGQAKFQPYTEDHPLHGLHPYDTSKSCTDLIAQSYAKCYGMPVVVSRFANVFGPGDVNWNRVVPGAMRALATGQEQEIRSNGQLTRDYVYVKDVARAYLILAKAAKAHAGEAFNCGSGIHLSALDLLAEIGRVVGKPVPHRILNTSQLEIPEQRLSDEKFRRLLGWQPTITFDQALQETWQWYAQLFAAQT